jgi:hypothetical protein
MNHWLFQIMYDWYPQSWESMIKKGIAAQNYPLHVWVGAERNHNALKKLDKDDFIVASFKRHRFAGYGRLISHFYIGGPSLEIPHRDSDNELLDFHERFNCEWTVIPVESGHPFIKCSDLKKQGYNIDMTRGLCVKQIDEESFNAIKSKLDSSGAKRVLSEIEMDNPGYRNLITIPTPSIESIVESDLDSILAEEQFEGMRGQRFITYYERNPKLRSEAISIHGYKCMACGFDFEQRYGERGSNYIEVHHLNPISSLEGETRVDPERDLAVVCSNCHSMIHLKKDEVLSLDELRKIIK